MIYNLLYYIPNLKISNIYTVTNIRNVAFLPDTGADGISIFILAGIVCFAGYEAVNHYEKKNVA